MEIKKYELKKVLTSKIMWLLIAVFMAFNIIKICSNSYKRTTLGYFNEIVDNVGYEINDDMKLKFESYYKENLVEANKLIKEKTGKEFEYVKDFMADYSYEEVFPKLSEEERNIILKTNFVEEYYLNIDILEKEYENITGDGIAENDIKMYRLEGNAAETARKNEKDAVIRIAEIKNLEEQKNLYYTGIHSLLYDEILKTAVIEIIILTVIMSAYLFNYEFENKTHLLSYTTRRGRKLTKDKLFISMVISILITTIILGLTLILFFLVFDCSKMWNIPVSSFFNWEAMMPNITWFSINFIQYTFLIVMFIYITVLILNLITFSISYFIRNTYIEFVIFAIISGIFLYLPNAISEPRSTNLIYTTTYTPFIFLNDLSSRSLVGGGLTGDKSYEIIVLLTWSIGMLLITFLLIEKFKKEDIKN